MAFYWTFFIAVTFAGLATTVRETLWNNLLTLCYIVLGGVIALGVYQPVTIFADEWSGGEYTYLLDLLGLWATYGAVVLGLKTVGLLLCDTQVRFLPPVEKYAAPAVGLLCGLTLACFALTTLHTAPFPKDCFGGSLVHAKDDIDPPSVFSMKPDLMFLAVASNAMSPTGLGNGQFSPELWVMDYAAHREKFEAVAKAKGFRGRVTRSENR